MWRYVPRTCTLLIYDFVMNVQMEAFKGSTPITQYCASDKINKNEMGWACSAYGGGERRVQGFGGEA